MVLAIVIDLILILDESFLFSVLALNNVASFDNVAHTFFFVKKLRHKFFNSTDRNILKIKNR